MARLVQCDNTGLGKPLPLMVPPLGYDGAVGGPKHPPPLTPPIYPRGRRGSGTGWRRMRPDQACRGLFGRMVIHSPLYHHLFNLDES